MLPSYPKEGRKTSSFDPPDCSTEASNLSRPVGWSALALLPEGILDSISGKPLEWTGCSHPSLHSAGCQFLLRLPALPPPPNSSARGKNKPALKPRLRGPGSPEAITSLTVPVISPSFFLITSLVRSVSDSMVL